MEEQLPILDSGVQVKLISFNAKDSYGPLQLPTLKQISINLKISFKTLLQESPEF